MKTSESIANVSAALVAAQAEFPKILKDKKVKVKIKSGGEYEFSYAPLDSIIDKVRPLLFANGLVFIQSAGDKTVVTRLIHQSGEWMETDPMPVLASSGSPQDYGSGISYARRYQLAALLGIASEDDDDANRASGNKAAGVKGQLQEEWDKLPKARQETLRGVSVDVIALLDEKRPEDAVSLLEKSCASDDEKMGIWFLFSAKHRSTLKTAADIIRSRKAN